MNIVVTTHFIDSPRAERRTFKTLKAARRYAHERVGRHPDVSDTFGYAVDDYGTAKVMVHGATLRDLFPAPEDTPPTPRPAGPCTRCRQLTKHGFMTKEGEWDEGRLHEWEVWVPLCRSCHAANALAHAIDLAVRADAFVRYARHTKTARDRKEAVSFQASAIKAIAEARAAAHAAASRVSVAVEVAKAVAKNRRQLDELPF